MLRFFQFIFKISTKKEKREKKNKGKKEKYNLSTSLKWKDGTKEMRS